MMTMSRTYHHGKRHHVAIVPKPSDLKFHAEQLFEKSAYFAFNMRSLSSRVAQGKVSPTVANHIRSAIAAQALRDARIPLTYSRHMLVAAGLRP